MITLSIRIDLGQDKRIGPGKIALLDKIDALGSIAAGGRALGMSYRRAWELVAAMNQIFGQPVLASKTGGKKGGGAALTPFGRALITRYRAIEKISQDATQHHLQALEAEIRTVATTQP